MPTTAKVICDSISDSGVRLTTMVLEYPRIIHSEFMTHRMFSRNASSSRAIPVEKQIERIKNEPFVPTDWRANQRGMQGFELISEKSVQWANFEWHYVRETAIKGAEELIALNVHKQLANRLLEPFSHIQVVVTTTEWDNFFLQRLDKNAQPEIQELAKVMKEAMDNSTPRDVKDHLTRWKYYWHLPFIEKEDWEREGIALDNELEVIQKLIKVSVARCARVSYGLNERGWGDIEKDLALYDMLLTNKHPSPAEHVATPMVQPRNYVITNLEQGVTHLDRNGNCWSGNLKGWNQWRHLDNW